MKIIYNLALLLSFHLLFSCDRAPVISKDVFLTRKPNIQKTVEPAISKMILRSADDGQTWEDIGKGLPGDKLDGSIFC